MKQKRLLNLRLSLSLLITFVTFSVNGQDLEISGTISDENNQGLPGVNILVKATTIGTQSDFDGNYKLRVPEGSTISISYIGYTTQDILVGAQTTIDVQMTPDANQLNEIVVIGYGSAKASDLTAPISVIHAEDIVKNITSNAVSSLQGSVSGLQVINNGAPGSAPEVRIRGIGSMFGAAPLYVVDGMFYNDINWLNPNEIESISILKDASAASIYGVRASNGVIIVKTKKGKLNQEITIEYDGYTGIKGYSNLPVMSNTEQYSILMTEAGNHPILQQSIDIWGASGKKIIYNGTEYSIPATNTNWQDELLSTGQIMNHSLSLKGGSEKAVYYLGASYFTEEGLLKSDHKYERINLKSSVDFTPYKFLELGANIVLSHNNYEDSYSDWFLGGTTSAWESMYKAVPTIPVRESNGDFAGTVQAGYTGGPVDNPAASLHYTQGNFNYNKDINLNYNVHADVKLLGNDKLVYRAQFSQQITNADSRTYRPEVFIDDKTKNEVSRLFKGYSKFSNIHLDHTLTYKDKFGKHGLTAMTGFSTRKLDFRNIAGSAPNVPNEKTEYLYFLNSTESDAAQFSVSDGGYSERGVSFFSRLMYNFDNKYLFNATFRGDGTDRYTQTWGYFPSFGVGWVLSEESFMESQKVFDYLKVRASWGRLGNNNVPRESGTRAITTGFNNSYAFNNILYSGYSTSVFFNELSWEVLEEINAGIDFSTLDNRLSIEIDMFRKITDNAAILTSNIFGGGALVRNKGEILNTGIETALGWRDKIGDFEYDIKANIGTLKNKVLNLGGEPYIDAPSLLRRTEPGHELNSFYGYEVIGVYQNQQEIASHIDTDVHTTVKPGYFKFKDLDGNKIIDGEDRVHLGSNIPKFTYGGQVNLKYKNMDFGVSYYGVSGNKIENILRRGRTHHPNYNFDVDLYDNRWTGEGTSNSYPSAEGLLDAWNYSSTYNNSFFVEDGSFFRIQNITLGYTINDFLPGSNNGSKMRIKLTSQNPFTFFKYNGFTPEVTGSGEAMGVHPIARSFNIGVNITY